MIIDVINMFNYQVNCNDSLLVGIVHSYEEGILGEKFLMNNLKLNRLKRKQSYIARAV